MANTNDFKLLLDSIPSYDGNPKTLTQFIIQVEDVNNILNSLTPSPLQKKIIFLNIKTKITGKANEELRNLQFETWEQLKNHLINNFADRQSPESVIIEIMKTNYSNKNIFKAITEVKEKFDLFRAKINLVESRTESKEDIIKFQELIITNNFISSLKDPLRNNLATRGPKTLLQVEQLLINDFQYLNTQNLDVPKTHKQLNRYLPANSYNKFPTSSPPYYKPQYKPQKDFAPQQRIQNGKNIQPTPMSIQTRQTIRPNPTYKQNYFQTNKQNPNFTSEELFTNETDENVETNDENCQDDCQNYSDYQINDDEDPFLDLGNITIQEKS